MNNFILICLFSIHTLGFSSSIVQTEPHPTTYLEPYQTESFLTTFIEGDQLYLSIPDHLLDTPMLFIRYDHSYKRQYMQVVWTPHHNQILLKALSIQSTAGIIIPLVPKLALSETILGIFPEEPKFGMKGSHCINITELVLRQNIEWFPGFSETNVPEISILMDRKDLDNEVIIKTNRGILINRSKISIPMYFAFSGLPEPMSGRNYDYRMGFYNERIGDILYGIQNSIANIRRWRLEKKHKDEKVSVPVKPITFIMSPEIPKKWRPYVKAGIEEWLPAFEAAGFKDALVVREVDSLSEWEMNSINNNIIYWGLATRLRGTEGGGFGGTISEIIDERTGEILKGDIHMASSHESYSEKYFIRAAPLDKRAQKFPFPDELLGELYQSLVAHEVGHVFGIMDANYGEYGYPFEKMNDVEWLESMGHTPSVMNYTRQNNIAQPEDNIPPILLNQRVGPMDYYHIQWGYTEFLPGTSIGEVDAALERIIRLQDSIPWYRYNYSTYEVIGPANTNEIVENRNPVLSTTMALKNLERVVALLPEVCRDQKDNGRLERLYGSVLELWHRHMQHVVSLVGGYDIQHKSINQPGPRYSPIDRASQKTALEFLMRHVIYPPNWLTEPVFDSRINYTVNRDQILEYQIKLVWELLRPQRMKRLEYMNRMNGYEGIFQDYLTTLQSGLFSELYNESGDVFPRNREIQLTYIDMLVRSLNQEKLNFMADEKIYDYTDYSKGLMMDQLMRLKKDLTREVKRIKPKDSVGHWALCLLKLEDIP